MIRQQRCEPTVYPSHDDLVWAAGFFDGEGTVSISRSHPTATRKAYRALQVSVGQVVRGPLDLLRNRWGGTVRPVRGRCMWHWRVCAFRARQFLQQVLPHLRVKRADAERGLRMELSEKQKEAS